MATFVVEPSIERSHQKIFNDSPQGMFISITATTVQCYVDYTFENGVDPDQKASVVQLIRIHAVFLSR